MYIQRYLLVSRILSMMSLNFRANFRLLKTRANSQNVQIKLVNEMKTCHKYDMDCLHAKFEPKI